MEMKMMIYFSLLIILFVSAQCDGQETKKSTTKVKVASFQKREKDILDSIFGPGKYDKRIRPHGVNGTEGPVISTVNVIVQNIESISDANMECTLRLIVRQKWNDDRLTFGSTEGIKYLILTEHESLWMPDLFFNDDKRGYLHDMTSPNIYIGIYSNGDVTYSTRITLTLSCPLNYVHFPHDQQACYLLMSTFDWPAERLTFLWQNKNPVIIESSGAPPFRLEKFNSNYCSTDELSCLRLSLYFKRQFSYYLLQYYIPCCMLVMISWVAFWLDTFATTARAALGITTILAMSMQVSSANKVLPPVSYITAFDLWTGVCFIFVFGSLIELAFVNFYSTLKKRGETPMESIEGPKSKNEIECQQKDVEEGSSGVEMMPLESEDSATVERTEICESGDTKKGLVKNWLAKYPSTSQRIDVISRIAFPLAFVIFNLAYFGCYA